MFPDLAALLLMSKDFAHRAHLRTTIFSHHLALQSLYGDLTRLTDEIVEMYQGRVGALVDIPYCDPPDKNLSVHDVLRSHLSIIEGVRGVAIPETDRPLQSKVDEICTAYLRALYKLTILL